MNYDRDLEEIDLSIPLEGGEGLDVNYISRVRTQYLFAQHQSLIAQTQFADAKAAALITLIGLIALRGPVAPHINSHSIFVYTYLGCAALCILFAFLSVIPRFPGRAKRERMWKADRWSWPSLASGTATPEHFARYMQTSEASELVHSVSKSNLMVARILLRKFIMLRIAFLLAIALLAMTGIRIAGFA